MTDRPAEEAILSPVQYRWFESLRDRNFRLLLGSSLIVHASNMMEMFRMGNRHSLHLLFRMFRMKQGGRTAG